MTMFEIAGMLALLLVLAAGTIIKVYTGKKLQDMDGIGGPIITTKKDADHVMHMKGRP